jgi:hypothetical protein
MLSLMTGLGKLGDAQAVKIAKPGGGRLLGMMAVALPMLGLGLGLEPELSVSGRHPVERVL